MKHLTLLGSTGSIGRQTLSIISDSNRFDVFALSCYNSISLIVEQAEKFHPSYIVIGDTKLYKQALIACNHIDTIVLSGIEGLKFVVSADEVDIVLTAMVGNSGLIPTVEAIKHGKRIALANKETLVTAGELIMPLAREFGAEIIPVDSEHSAIFQCLQGNDHQSVKNLILTASGGAFREFTKEEIYSKKASDALKHPNWNMGNKITIDSATLMNKGLEFIEARWLFGLEPESIQIVVHPQSIIHSMVEFNDHSVIAQMGNPDMRLPIIYALDYPNRFPNLLEPLDFLSLNQLTFDKADIGRFPCLEIALDALKMGGLATTIMNAANEVLVDAYLKDKIGFYDISDEIQFTIQSFNNISSPTLSQIIEADMEVREFVSDRIWTTFRKE